MLVKQGKEDIVTISEQGKALLTSQMQPIQELTGDKSPFELSEGDKQKLRLALDLNHDNKINDGKELFGTSSGDGFADLAQYDSDGNQWIDEHDPIFQNPRIWTKDAEGKDQLFALGQEGIGAIYLGNVQTEFAIKDNDNEFQGKIRWTGIFLKKMVTWVRCNMWI